MKTRFSWTSFNLQSCSKVLFDPCLDDCIAQVKVQYSGSHLITDLKRLNMCSSDTCYVGCLDTPWVSNITFRMKGISFMQHKI